MDVADGSPIEAWRLLLGSRRLLSATEQRVECVSVDVVGLVELGLQLGGRLGERKPRRAKFNGAVDDLGGVAAPGLRRSPSSARPSKWMSWSTARNVRRATSTPDTTSSCLA